MKGVVGTELRKVRAEPIFFRCAFALISWAIPPGRQALIAAREYGHYLKDRREGPIILKGKLEYKRQ